MYCSIAQTVENSSSLFNVSYACYKSLPVCIRRGVSRERKNLEWIYLPLTDRLSQSIWGQYFFQKIVKKKVRKEFCYQRLFWPFTVWINCSSDLNFFFKFSAFSLEYSFSRSLEQFFLTVGQNNFGNKIPNLIVCTQNVNICSAQR